MKIASSTSPFSPSLSYPSESVVQNSSNSTQSNSSVGSCLVAVSGSGSITLQTSKSNSSNTVASPNTVEPLVAMGLNATDFGTLPAGPSGSGSAIPGAMQAYKQSAPVLTETYCEICNRQFCNKYFLKTHKENRHGIFTPDEPNIASPSTRTPRRRSKVMTDYSSSQRSQLWPSAVEEAIPSGVGSGACEAALDFPLLARIVQSCESARAQGAGSGSGMESVLMQSEPVNLALLASLVRPRDLPATSTAPPAPHGGADALALALFRQQQSSPGSPFNLSQHQQQSGPGIYEYSNRGPDLSAVPKVGDGSSSTNNTGSAFKSANVLVQGNAPILQQQEHLNGANTRDTCAELSASLRFEHSQQQQLQQEEEFHSKRLLSDGAIGADDCSQDRGEERTLVDLSVRSRAVTRVRVRAPSGEKRRAREKRSRYEEPVGDTWMERSESGTAAGLPSSRSVLGSACSSDATRTSTRCQYEYNGGRGSFQFSSTSSSNDCTPEAYVLEAKRLQMRCDEKQVRDDTDKAEDDVEDEKDIARSCIAQELRASNSEGSESSISKCSERVVVNATNRSPESSAISSALNRIPRRPPSSLPATPTGSLCAPSPTPSIPELQSQPSIFVGGEQPYYSIASQNSPAAAAATPITPTAVTSASTCTAQVPWSAALLERLNVPDAVLRELACAYLNAIAGCLNEKLRAIGAQLAQSGGAVANGPLGYADGPSWTHSPPEDATSASANVHTGAGLGAVVSGSGIGTGSSSGSGWGQGPPLPPSPGWDLAGLLQAINLSQQLNSTSATAAASVFFPARVPSQSHSHSEQQPEPECAGGRAYRQVGSVGVGIGVGKSGRTETIPVGGIEEVAVDEKSATQEPLDLTTNASAAGTLYRDL